MNVFGRGSISVTARHGVCHACKGKSEQGLDFYSSASESSLLICARCLADLFLSALPALSRDLERLYRAQAVGT